MFEPLCGANQQVQFVAGNHYSHTTQASGHDDMLDDESNVALTRSSPSPNLVRALAPVACAATEDTRQDYDPLVMAVEAAATIKTIRDVLNPTPHDSARSFLSIADVAPLSKVSLAKVGTPSTVRYVHDDTVDDDATVREEADGDVTTMDDGDASTRSVIRMKPNTRLPGTTAVGVVYRYNATEVEEDEMEELRWTIHQQVFQRYSQLEQKCDEWGQLAEQDTRVVFVHGVRRERITAEKKFHDNAVRDAVGKANAAWVEERRNRVDEEVRQFYHDEMRHRQALTLTRLEKMSPFCKFPILGNRFLPLRLRGKGGHGEVWDVVDFADNKKLCALKLSTSICHAKREHHVHSRLKHPNIVQVGEVPLLIRYQQQQYTAFTVASVHSDLQQLIEIHEFFDDDSAYKVLSQLLSAQRYLHEDMGIAHYDLKPSNILIDQDGCVKLTDFDLARDAKSTTSNSTVGTLRYLPPECFRPKRGDCEATAEKADMWMVGIVYCMMITGKHPICPVKLTPAEFKSMMSRYTGAIQYARPVSDLSRWIIQGCLQPDPRCRPTAAQLLVALQNVMLQQCPTR
uniref:Protein kinase domain-containing protein n=1 Tax=Peronospora matthiolae TaxID=2874970 RepID=A0AAV1UPT1_9STRA